MNCFEKTKRFAFIIFGCAVSAFGINAFLVPNSIATGGFSGVAILVNKITHIPVGATVMLMNVPLFIVGFRHLGKRFVYSSLFGMVAYSLLIDAMETLPIFTKDIVLCSVYGGLCVGFGLGIVLKYGATTGGTDMLAKLITLKSKGFPMGQMIFFMDVAVIVCSVLLIGLDKGLYSIIAVFLSGRVIDVVIQGVGKAKSFFIITEKGNSIANAIMFELGRGVTEIKGTGAFTGNEKSVLVCAVSSRSEISYVKDVVHKWDKKAFILIGDMTEVLGEGFCEEK